MELYAHLNAPDETIRNKLIKQLRFLAPWNAHCSPDIREDGNIYLQLKVYNYDADKAGKHLSTLYSKYKQYLVSNPIIKEYVEYEGRMLPYVDPEGEV